MTSDSSSDKAKTVAANALRAAAGRVRGSRRQRSHRETAGVVDQSAGVRATSEPQAGADGLAKNVDATPRYRDPIAAAESSIGDAVALLRELGTPFGTGPTVRLDATARFGAERLGHSTLGQTLDWVRQNAEQVPDVVAEEVAALGDVRLRALNPNVRSLGEQFSELRDACYRWEVFAARCLAWPAPTLETLGDRYGVTRERIRQIAQRDTEFIESELERLAPGLAAARDRLRERFGVAVLVGGDEDRAWKEQTRIPDHPQLEGELHSLLLWLAGYEQHEGSWTIDPDHGTKAAEAVASALGSSWLLSEHDLLETGLSRDVMMERPEWRDIGGGWFLRLDGGAKQKAERILALTLRPMTAQELATALDDGTTDRNLANQMSASDIFCRVDKHGSVALVEWGLEEYSGIAEEIRQRIERGDGQASVAAIIAEFTTTFGVSESSVRSYLNGALFNVDGDAVTLAADPGAAFNRRHPGTVKGSTLTDAGWGQTVTTTTQNLDGYSFVVNPHIAAANKLELGADLLVPLWIDHEQASDEVSLIWRPTSLNGVDVGRARRALLESGIEAGSELIIVPTPEGVHFFTDQPDAPNDGAVGDDSGCGSDPALDFLFR